MGRVVRRVPASWEHPKDKRGYYIPLHTHFPYNEDEVAEGLTDGWLDADEPNYGIGLMPTWDASEATHFQLYETTTEGTPLGPVFDNLDALCEWAAENATVFANFKASAEEWRRMLDDGMVYHQSGNMTFT